MLQISLSKNSRLRYAIIASLLTSCEQIIDTPPLENTFDPKYSGFVPEEPREVIIDQRSDKAVDVYWSNRSQHGSRIRVERSDGSAPFHLLSETPKDTTHFTDTTGVHLGTPYVYRIGSVASNGNVGYSIKAPFTFSFPPPSELRAASPDLSQINLSWVNNASFATGFLLERAVNKGTLFETIASTSSLEAIDSNLFIDDEYDYRVRAFTQSNLSDPSLPMHMWFVPDSGYLLFQRGAFSGNTFGPVVVSEDKEYVALGTIAWPTIPPSYYVLIVRPSFNQIVHYLTGFTDYITALQFSPNSQSIATADNSGRVRIWNVSSGQEVLAFSNPTPATALAYSPDGQILACGSNGVQIRNASSGDTILTWSESGSIKDIVFSPDGSTILLATSAGRINWRNVNTGSLINTRIITGGTTFKFSANAQYVAGISPGQIAVMKTSDWTVVRNISAASTSAVVSNDGTLLVYVNSSSNYAIVFDLRKNMIVKLLQIVGLGSGVTPQSIGSSPDALTIASGCGSGTISTWQVFYRWTTTQ